MKQVAFALILMSSTWAASTTLTMDELPNQPINGLNVTKGGFTFTFADTQGARYFSPNGGTLTFTQDPVIEGVSATGEVITVGFSVPVRTIQFGFVESLNVGPPVQLASVGLYNGATLLGTRTFNSTLQDMFDEGQFVYTGDLGPVTSIQIAATSNGGAAFGFDNLFVDTNGVATTPAPSSLGLVLIGLLLVGGFSYRFKIRRRQSA